VKYNVAVNAILTVNACIFISSVCTIRSLRGKLPIYLMKNNFSIQRINCLSRAVPWLRRLVAGLSPRRPGFNPESVHVGFVVDKVALRQVFFFSEYFGFPLSI
jgi:hypothetical protein